MSGLRKDAGFLTHIKSTNPNEAYAISEEMKGRVGNGVDEFIFLPNTVTPTEYTCLQEKVPKVGEAKEEEKKEEKEKPSPTSFLRIVNVKTFFASTEATLTITPAEYKAAQKLGLTKNIDQALTAKVIGTLGDFRYQSRRDAVLYGIYDDVYLAEETICQTIFERAEALQGIERAHGGTPAELATELTRYIEQLEGKIALEQDPSLKASYQKDLAHAKTLRDKAQKPPEQDPKAKPSSEYKEYNDLLKNDLEAFLHERLNEAVRHGRETDELVTVASRSINPFRGRLTTALVNADQLVTEHRFDQNRRAHKEHQGDYSEKVGTDGRITLTSFHAQLGDQKATMKRFTMTAALVLGNPPPEDPLTYQAGRATWSSVGWARIVVSAQQSWQGFKKSASEFWHHTVLNEARPPLLLPEDPEITEKYNAYLAKAEGAKLGFISVGLQDLGNLIRDGVKALGVSLASIFTGLFEAFSKLYLDFQHSSNIERAPKKHEPETLEELAENLEWNSKSTGEQIQAIFDGITHRLNEDRGGTKEKAKAAVEKPQKPLTKKQQEKADEIKAKQERIRAKIEKFIQDYKEKKLDQAPLALPPHALVAYNPDDLLSAGFGGMESFYQFFANMHDENPSICVYAMSVYLLAVASMAAPALVAATGAKANIQLGWFAEFNRLSGVAMANGEMAQITSVAFTDWQIITTVLEGLVGGEDSMVGVGASFTKGHFIQVVGGVMAVYGVGALLTHLFPIFEEELGTTPQILQFFTGLKAVVGGYEAFESAPHERSIVGSFLFDVIDLAVLVGIRCPLSILNGLYMAILRPIGEWIGIKIGIKTRLLPKDYQYKSFNWVNVLRPWAEFAHKIVSIAVRGFDFLLRFFNLLGRILKMLTKAVTDFVFGWAVFLTKAVPIILLLAFLIVFSPFIALFTPDFGRFMLKEIGDTLKGLKNDTHKDLSNPKAVFTRMAIEKQKDNALTESTETDIPRWSGKWIAFKIWHCDTKVPSLLIKAKFAIYGVVDHYITRPIKNIYKGGRNMDARYLNRREAQIDKVFLKWVEERMAGKKPQAAGLEMTTSPLTPLHSAGLEHLRKPRPEIVLPLQPANQPSDLTVTSTSSPSVENHGKPNSSQ